MKQAKRNLISLKTLTLDYESNASYDVKDVIGSTILGNPDGIRYRQLDALRKIEEIAPLHFFTLRRKGELIYVMALAERITSLQAEEYHSYYVRYVSFNENFAAQKLSNISKHNSFQRMSNSIIKEGMRRHAEDFEGELKSSGSDGSKKIYYAYVEESNLRSLNFTQFFFTAIRNFSVIPFSRFFPSLSKNVAKPEKEDVPKLVEMIKEVYQSHSFFFLDEASLGNDYYIWKENDEIIAGLKVQKVDWQIVNLPGFLGKILKNVLPLLPLFSRIIHKDRFSFLTFDTIICSPNQEQVLPRLFESVCAIEKTYAAMLYVDEGDPCFNRLKELKNMGLLNRLYSKSRAAIMARFVNFTPAEKEKFRQAPAYISAYDLT